MTMLFPRAKFKRTRALADIEALQSQANAHFLELVLNLVGHLSYNQALQYIYSIQVAHTIHHQSMIIVLQSLSGN